MPRKGTRQKHKTSLALTTEAQKLLAKLAEWWGTSQSDALEFLIRRAFDMRFLAPEEREAFQQKVK